MLRRRLSLVLLFNRHFLFPPLLYALFYLQKSRMSLLSGVKFHDRFFTVMAYNRYTAHSFELTFVIHRVYFFHFTPKTSSTALFNLSLICSTDLLQMYIFS